MIRKLCYALIALLLPLSPAQAGEVSPDPMFFITVPDGWDSLGPGTTSQAPAEVTTLMDCGISSLLGWKKDDEGSVQAAYCISLQKRGMGRMREILKSSTGDIRQKASDKFIDAFASQLSAEYSVKRKMTLSDLSADLMDADNDVILIMDGKVSGNNKELWRSLVLFMHDDSLLNISFIYDVRTPESIVRKLDSMLTTVRWN